MFNAGKTPQCLQNKSKAFLVTYYRMIEYLILTMLLEKVIDLTYLMLKSLITYLGPLYALAIKLLGHIYEVSTGKQSKMFLVSMLRVDLL